MRVSPRGLGLKPAAASGAPCFLAEFPGSGAPDTLGAPACDSSPIFSASSLRPFHFLKTRCFQESCVEKVIQSRCRLSQRVYHAHMARLKTPTHSNEDPGRSCLSPHRAPRVGAKSAKTTAKQSVNLRIRQSETAAPARTRVR